MISKKLREMFPLDLPGLSLDPGEMDTRLRKQISRGEFVGLSLTLVVTGLFVWLMRASGVIPFDYTVFMNAPQDAGFRYGFWIVPLFQIFQNFPFVVGYIIWSIMSIACVFFAARVFGGSALIALASFQMISLMYYGNYSGIMVGGMGLFWYAMARKNWMLAGLGLTLAGAKYHFLVFIGLPLLWWLKPDLRTLMKISILPILWFIGSVWLYPHWIPEIVQNLRVFDYNTNNTVITLWADLGYYSLLFWLPVILLPLPRNRRLFAMLITAFIASPYWLAIDLLILFILPVGFLPLFGLFGSLNSIVSSILPVYKALLIILYFSAILPPAIRWVNSMRPKQRAETINREPAENSISGV